MKGKVLVVGDKNLGEICDACLGEQGYATEHFFSKSYDSKQIEAVLRVLLENGSNYTSVVVCGSAELASEISSSGYKGEVVLIAPLKQSPDYANN